MKPLFVMAFLLGTLGATYAQQQKPNFTAVFTARTSREQVRKPQTLENQRILDRTPLFENMPFLRLKPNDQLVEAQQRRHFAKSGETKLLSKELYIHSGATWLNVPANWDGQKAFFFDATASPLFAWDFSLVHARNLASLPRTSPETPLSYPQWLALKARLQQTLPAMLRTQTVTPPRNPFVQDGHAVIEALIYKEWENRIIFRRTNVSPQEFSVQEWLLVVGPPHVDEWETHPTTGFVINGPGPLSADALKRNRDNYELQRKLHQIVEEVIPASRPR